MTYKYEHGLSIMRCQPLHIGHMRIIEAMLRDCEHVTILLGSIQEHGTARNPLNYTTRKKMFQNVYRDRPEYERMRIMGIQDIYNEAEWASYVLGFISDSFPEKPRVDAYYAGTINDYLWFKPKGLQFELIDRTDPAYPFVCSSMLRDMWKYQDDRWKNYVPEENWKIIEEHIGKKGDIKLRVVK